MLRLFFALILLNFVMGCASSEVKSGSGPAQLSICHFDEIPSPNYALNPIARHGVMTLFFYDPTQYLNQYEGRHYQQLTSQLFKVVKTGVISQETVTLRKPSLSKSRMIEEEYNGQVYQRDQSLSTKIITENCHVYYARGNKLKKANLTDTLLKADQSPLTDQDILDFFGPDALIKEDLTPKIVFDSVDSIWRVDSPRYQHFLLQGIVDAKSKQILSIQLYAEIHFMGEWAKIDSAEDHEGRRLSLMQVAIRSDCPLKLNKCHRTEVVRVELDPTSLAAHTGNYKVRLYGFKEKTLWIPAEMTRKFLDQVNKKMGKGAIQVASSGLQQPAWQMNRNLMSPRYTTRWDELLRVKA